MVLIHSLGEQSRVPASIPSSQALAGSCLCVFPWLRPVAGEGWVSTQGQKGCANKIPNIYSFQESSKGLDQQFSPGKSSNFKTHVGNALTCVWTVSGTR